MTTTASLLSEQLAAAEEQLARNAVLLERIELQELCDDGHDENDSDGNSPLPVRLQRLDEQANELTFLTQVTEWAKQRHTTSQEDEAEDGEARSIANDLASLQELTALLGSANTGNTTAMLSQHVYQHEFVPLYEYLQSTLILALREQLHQVQYPTACEKLLQDWEMSSSSTGSSSEESTAVEIMKELQTTCAQLQTLQGLNVNSVASSLSFNLPDHRHHGGGGGDNGIILVRELVRPLVQRVHYHFLETDKSRPTTIRTDRLPEWLWDYIRQHFFDSGAWELVQDFLLPNDETAAATPGAADVLNEIICLIQWVLAERNFFGVTTKPILLANAMEQLLQMDLYVQNLGITRVVSLMDACVTGQEDLLQWWLDRERQAAMELLHREELPLLSHHPHGISPRAELFCALLKSLQTKASVLGFPGPFLAAVAAPLSVEFVEALHDSAADLQDSLWTAETTPQRWMELINGTHLAAQILLQSEASTDLARLGRSLSELQEVLLQKFNNCFLLHLERSQLASYLMRSSFLLSQPDDGSSSISSGDDELSNELYDTRKEINDLLHVFKKYTSVEVTDQDSLSIRAAQFAPRRMRHMVLTELADKFLDICLNADGMTNELQPSGCRDFARDVKHLFYEAAKETQLPAAVLKLRNVVALMSLERDELVGLGNALCGLAGQVAAPLDYYRDFEDDELLIQEATAMIHAKGFVWVELPDVLDILNRRRDLLVVEEDGE